MKKIKNKNFIAFTLSEMMVVLLIVSVISAATLPAITGKQQSKPKEQPTPWAYDYYYNGGHYTDQESNRMIVIGADITNFTSGNRTNHDNISSKSTIKLVRPNMFNLVTQNRSDIAFFNHLGEYTGKIAADARGNLAVGMDVAYPHDAAAAAYGNIFFGTGAGYGMSPYIFYSNQKYNTIIGYSAASNKSSVGSENVIIGREISNANIGNNNVIIGNFAGRDSYYAGVNSSYNTNENLAKKYNNTVSIGFHSSDKASYVVSSVNIGPFAGATNGDRAVNGFFNVINLGSFAGYKGGNNFSKYSYINIGEYAGSFRPSNRVSTGGSWNFSYDVEPITYSTINIGPWAGSRSALYAINIGRYAGYQAFGGSEFDNTHYNNSKRGINIGACSGQGSTTGEMAVNIGFYAGYGSGTRGSVNIGHYANAHMNPCVDHFDSVAIGAFASFHNTDTKYPRTRRCVSIGKYAGYNTFSQDSVYIGSYAGSGKGTSGYPSVSSDYIISINCGSQRIEGFYKMCIGGGYPYNDDWTTTGWTPKNRDSSAYGQMIIMTPGKQGGSNVGWNYTAIYLLASRVYAYTNTLTASSDKTLKENIKKTKYGINKLRKVIIYQYNMKGQKQKSIGVIAQEFMKEYPDAVTKTTFPNSDGKEYYTVSSDWLMFSLAQSIKDVDNSVIGLQKQLVKNVSDLTKLVVAVNGIENRLNVVSASNKNLQAKLSEIDKMISDMEHK